MPCRVTKAAALATALVACAHGAPPPSRLAAPAAAPSPPAPAAPATLRLVRLPQPNELTVVERTPEATRVVWGGLRAELRGDAIAWADLVGGAPIREVARDGARWVFRTEGGALFASGSFLGPWTRLATPWSPADAAGPRRVGSFVGPALFRDGRARVWRVHDGVVRPIALPWPAHVLALRFDTPLDGVVAVDGPRWLFTRDAGATWRLGRSPAGCVDALADWSPSLHAAPPPGSDELRCDASAYARPPDDDLLRRRLAFDLAARDPAYLPMVEPVLLEAGTLAAFDGTHLRRYDAASWRERDRVPTTWPADLRIEGRLAGGLRGHAPDDRRMRLWADGRSRRLEPGDVGASLALHADRVGHDHAVTGLRCDLTWRTLGDAETDLGRPCDGRRAILFGDDAVELDESAPEVIRAWPATPGAADRTLYRARAVGEFGASLDGRWLYALGVNRDREALELAWGDAEARWQVVALPEGATSVAFASPGLAFAAGVAGHLWRMDAGGEGWTRLALVPSLAPRFHHQTGLFCAEAYCQVARNLVVADPLGAPPDPTPPVVQPAAPAPRPGPSYACARGARLALPVRDAQCAAAGCLWVDEPPGAIVRHRVNWLGVDERGVFTGRGPVAAGLAFAGREVALAAVSRAGVVAVSRGDDQVGALFEASAGGTRLIRAVSVEAGDDWWRVGACDFGASRANDWWVTPHPRDGAAEVPWRTAAAGLHDAPLWLFARGDACGAAVERADEDALAVHGLLPDRGATPRRESRPAFESARPCTATAAPDATRWRMEAADAVAPLHLGAASVVAEYESADGSVCLRRAAAVEPAGDVIRVLAAQRDGALAGVELIEDTAWSVRCDAR